MRKAWGGFVLVIGLAACGGGDGESSSRDDGASAFGEHASSPSLGDFTVQPTDSLGANPDVQSVACTTAHVGLAAAQAGDVRLAQDALDTIDNNYAHVFPLHYEQTIPRGAGTVIKVGWFQRAVGLCVRDLGPAPDPLPTEIPTVPTLPPVSTQPPPSPAAYDLTGTGTVMVTLANETGGTEQFTTALPYHRDLATTPDFLYISAQLQGSGEVTCQVRNNFVVIQTATSSGQYVIATCSGSG